MDFTVFTFIQVFYLLSFNLYKYATFFLPYNLANSMTIDLQLAHLLRCRITDRGVGDHDAASTGCRYSATNTKCRKRQMGKGCGERQHIHFRSQVAALHVRVAVVREVVSFQLRSISEGFPTLRSAWFSPIHRQRHLKIPTDALLGLTGWRQQLSQLDPQASHVTC